MTHSQIEIGCGRSGTPNANKNPSKTVTSRKLDCPFRLYARKYAKSTTCTLKVKDPEDKLQGRKPIDALIDTLKQENAVWSSARDSEVHIMSLFFTHPLAIKLLHDFPHVIVMDCTYKTNKYKSPFLILLDSAQPIRPFLGLFVS
ncbi:hypothetical protein O181_034534 [Austropuccinia psidii MF-1]|uniref:MULE transposase domain-containing protein n=1 Tax=Austropuccinia psidii MF-1 TaxID=1389203 RepID=A0A9Q3D0X8_9BASI|nr:hypothetical protein [Austropuccinia psidii MF-1]